MKKPNGYGTVTKSKENRRKPWRAQVTIGWEIDDSGNARQKRLSIGYFETQEEALRALADYNMSPEAFGNNVTFRELYDRFKATKFPTIDPGNQKNYETAFRACSALHDMKMRDIKLVHLQSVIDKSGKNYPTLKKYKTLLTQMFSYASKYDIVAKDYASMIDIAQYKKVAKSDDTELDDNEGIHKPFTADEIDLLWQNADRNVYIGVVLMLIYSGVRISDLLTLKKSSVNLEGRWFRVLKSKTAAGTRLVPIAEKVVPFWEYWMSRDGEYVLQGYDTPSISYTCYVRTYFVKILEKINISDHLPHDTRHTCISMLQRKCSNKLIIKRIVGHKGTDVTDKVYTHTEIQELIDAINLI